MIEDTRFPVPLGEGVVTVAALYERRQCSKLEIVGGHRPPLQLHPWQIRADFRPHFVDHVMLICY